jgi:hypothetical protein
MGPRPCGQERIREPELPGAFVGLARYRAKNARSIQTGFLRLGCVCRLAFRGGLVRIPVKPAWSLAFGEVEFALNLLLPTREAGRPLASAASH